MRAMLIAISFLACVNTVHAKCDETPHYGSSEAKVGVLRWEPIAGCWEWARYFITAEDAQKWINKDTREGYSTPLKIVPLAEKAKDEAPEQEGKK